MQSPSTCLEDLPTVIFRLIQDFLVAKDKRRLMNCNSINFARIKYETIIFNLSDPREWIYEYTDLHSDADLDFEEEVGTLNQFMKDKVKTKATQITIFMKSIPAQQLLQFSPSSQGILRLTLENVSNSSGSFDFHLFNNIHHVKLSKWEGLEKITSGFENVKILELDGFQSLISIIDINTSRTLKELKLIGCRRLRNLSLCMEQLTHFQLKDCSSSNFIPLLQTMSNIKELWIEIYQKIKIPIDLSGLEKLDLFCKFPATLQYINGLERIPNLSLTVGFLKSCVLNRFYGHQLCLELIDASKLFQWMSNDPYYMQFLRNLKLDDCAEIIYLPELPNLSELHILDCSKIESIPTLIKLRSLKIESGDALLTISPNLPSLKTCSISYCSKLHNLPIAKDMMKVILIDCPCITDISMLGHVKNLYISECDGVTSLTGLAGTNTNTSSLFSHDERTITLDNLKNVHDFSTLHDIGTVYLINISNLRNCEGMHNIRCLVMKSCPDFTSTSGLRDENLDELIIMCCNSFEALVEVEDVSGILLVRQGELIDDSGIRNHAIAVSRTVSDLSVIQYALT